MTMINYPDGTQCYMDNRLAQKIDKVKARLRKDDDIFFIIDGQERSGKSVFAQQLAKKIDSSFNHHRMCMTVDAFENAIDLAKPGQAIVFDEGYRGFSRSNWAKSLNKSLKKKMMEIGQKNLAIIIVMPTFFELDPYITMHRARGLFHIYRKKGQRGFWIYFNNKKMKVVYKKGKDTRTYGGKGFPSSRLKGRFLDQYVIDEVAYRDQKAKSYEVDDHSDGLPKFALHRNLLLKYLKEENKWTYEKLRDVCLELGIDLNISSLQRAIVGVKFKK